MSLDELERGVGSNVAAFVTYWVTRFENVSVELWPIVNRRLTTVLRPNTTDQGKSPRVSNHKFPAKRVTQSAVSKRTRFYLLTVCMLVFIEPITHWWHSVQWVRFWSVLLWRHVGSVDSLHDSHVWNFALSEACFIYVYVTFEDLAPITPYRGFFADVWSDAKNRRPKTISYI